METCFVFPTYSVSDEQIFFQEEGFLDPDTRNAESETVI